MREIDIVDVEFSEEMQEKLEEFQMKQELHRMVDEALEDIKAGRFRPFEEVMAEIKEKYNL
jgi:predicted transcriptional regulator